MIVYENKDKIIKAEKNCLLYYNDGILHSKVYLDDPFRYSLYLITTVSCLLNNAQKILILGAGLGTAMLQVKKMIPKCQITVVDIDKEVFALGESFLRYSKYSGVEFVVADALKFVKYDKEFYDYIMVDLTKGGNIVDGSYEIAFFQDIYSRLTDNGIMAFNSSMRDFEQFDKLIPRVNPLNHIYSNMYNAGFHEVIKIDFNYSGWIHCYKSNVILPFEFKRIDINKSPYIKTALGVQRYFSHVIDKSVVNNAYESNGNLIALYRDYLFELIFQIKRIDFKHIRYFENEREELIKLFLEYVKKHIAQGGIGNAVKNMYICSDINYFRELNYLLSEEEFHFECITNIVMMPSRNLCMKVGELMRERKFMQFGVYQFDEVLIEENEE